MVFITADTHGELERLADKKLKYIKILGCMMKSYLLI